MTKLSSEELDKSIAARRMKRDSAEQRKHAPVVVYEEVRRKDPPSKKSKERGWFQVESIIGHRVSRIKNKDQIELKVKWQDYNDPTWEQFAGFVKDAGPLVERYLIKKSLMKTLQEYQELKLLKKGDGKGIFDKFNFGGLSSVPKST